MITSRRFLFYVVSAAVLLPALAILLFLQKTAGIEAFESPKTAVVESTALYSIGLNIVGYLHNPNEAVRVVTAQSMGTVGSSEIVDSLLRALDDWSPAVREMIIESLGKLNDSRAIKPLVRKVKDGSPGVRRAVALALGKLGDKSVVPALIEGMKDWDAEVRASICWALGELGDNSAVEVLWPRLLDGDYRVRSEAAIAIAKLKAPGASQALLKLLDEWDIRVRRSAIVGLGILKERGAANPICRSLTDADASIRVAAAIALGKIGEPSSVEFLLKRTGDWVPEPRAAVATALGNFAPDERIKKALFTFLADPHAAVRAAAIGSIGMLRLSSYSDAVISKLGDWDDSVRTVSAQVLGLLKAKQAVKPLIIALGIDPQARVREEVAISLGLIGDPSAIPALRKATEDWDSRVGKESAASIRVLSQVKQ